jgi:hypothetical protein
MKSQFILLLLVCLIALVYGKKITYVNNEHSIDTSIAQDEQVIDDGQQQQEEEDSTPTAAAVTTTSDDAIIPTNEVIPTTTAITPSASSDIPVSDTPIMDTPTMTTSVDNTLPTSVESELPQVPVNRTVNPLVCQALQQWYNSLNGNSWIIRTGWDSTDMTSCCSWFNVRCNNIGQVLRV